MQTVCLTWYYSLSDHEITNVSHLMLRSKMCEALPKLSLYALYTFMAYRELYLGIFAYNSRLSIELQW